MTGDENKLFENYFSDRQQYVCIDTYSSSILKSPQCNVVQGSKLSGLMYNVYTNVVPLLHQLMDSDIYYRLTNDQPCKVKSLSIPLQILLMIVHQ